MGINYIKILKSIAQNSESDFLNEVILEKLVAEITNPIILMDKNFKILFVNEPLLRFYEKTFDDVFKKNYLGIASKSEDEFGLIKGVYDKVVELKKPMFIDLESYHSYIHIFPILSPETGDVKYFQNVYVIDEKHLALIKEHKVNFNNDYVLFAHQLSVLLATKDRYTAQHSSNVSEYAALLGREIGVEKAELEMLKVAGSLHDIGKINIPNSILNNKSKLSPEDKEVVRKHPIYSSQILRDLKLHELSQHGRISDVGLYHHEWYDGTGYPYGLKGKEIPLAVRLITLVDSFDAMTTNRPYRGAMSLENALDEILKNAGTHFDPYLVNKFVNIDLKYEMSKIGEFDRSYMDDYTITENQVQMLRENVKEIFRNIDPYDLLKFLCDNGVYGIVISEYLNNHIVDTEPCYRIIYKNEYFDKLIKDMYFADEFEICFRRSSSKKCEYCPVSNCMDSMLMSTNLLKATNKAGEIKYLSTILYPAYDKETGKSIIIEIVKDITIEQSYSRDSSKEFFAVTKSLTNLFAEQNKLFSKISGNIEMLANWIAAKIEISGYEVELLNKAISICDLGIIPLLDSNEYSFESIAELRHNNEHIKVIDDLLMSIVSFEDVKDIVLYHHTSYNDGSSKLYREQVPVQSYIIGITDFLLTQVVLGSDISETLKFAEDMTGIKFLPRICKIIFEDNNKKELIEILKSI